MGDTPTLSVRSSGAVKQLRNVQRPRPLRMVPSQVEELVEQVKQAEAALREKLYYSEAVQNIYRLNKQLKQHGSALESYNKVYFYIIFFNY
jgi:hypothetical protein